MTVPQHNDIQVGRAAQTTLAATASASTVASAARGYAALGFSVIPLRGKVPVVTWREYQQRRPTQAELQRWLRRGLFDNVGIVCGAVSGRLVVLDFDASEVYRAFCERFPALARTYTVATGGGGRHIYLRVDALPPSRRGQGVELCAEGRQVVAPPSTHPTTGRPYRVHLSLDIRPVPDLSEVIRWMGSASLDVKAHHLPGEHPSTLTGAGVQAALVAAIAETLRARGYRQKGDWLNGPCIYPERHAHNDSKTSFGFNTRTGYGYCFVCGSMLAKDIACATGVDPTPPGGVIALKGNTR